MTTMQAAGCLLVERPHPQTCEVTCGVVVGGDRAATSARFWRTAYPTFVGSNSLEFNVQRAGFFGDSIAGRGEHEEVGGLVLATERGKLDADGGRHQAVDRRAVIDPGVRCLIRIQDYINTLTLPGEQLSALWLLAWARRATDPATRRRVVERDARLCPLALIQGALLGSGPTLLAGRGLPSSPGSSVRATGVGPRHQRPVPPASSTPNYHWACSAWDPSNASS